MSARTTRIVAGVAVVLLIGVGLYKVFGPSDPFGGVVSASRWQAVTLVDGQMLFGHLGVAGDELYLLRDAFFVEQVAGEKKDDPPAPRVRRLREATHGPESQTLIPRDKVLRIENLRPDSDAAAAIREVLGATEP